MLLDVALLILAIYFIQEGLAQRKKGFVFFVEFPQNQLWLAYAAVLLLIPNFAITFFVLLRGLWVRRWPWLTTLLAAICLGVITATIGLDGVKRIIAP